LKEDKVRKVDGSRNSFALVGPRMSIRILCTYDDIGNNTGLTSKFGLEPK
jgi:hypothetical protein